MGRLFFSVFTMSDSTFHTRGKLFLNRWEIILVEFNHFCTPKVVMFSKSWEPCSEKPGIIIPGINKHRNYGQVQSTPVEQIVVNSVVSSIIYHYSTSLTILRGRQSSKNSKYKLHLCTSKYTFQKNECTLHINIVCLTKTILCTEEI